MDDLFEKLEEACKEHDWAHNFSDDYEVWKSGQQERSHIRSLYRQAIELDAPRAERIYNKYKR
jgi:hypothetical protein